MHLIALSSFWGELYYPAQQIQLAASRKARISEIEDVNRIFVHDRIIYDVELILAKNECRPTRLGSPQMSRLGLDTWFFSSDSIGEVSAVFPLS